MATGPEENGATGATPAQEQVPVDFALGTALTDMTTFIGRGALLQATIELLGTMRLVTLIGVGGLGKTRLLERLAGELAEHFDEVVLISLAGLRATEDRLASTIAEALGLPNNSPTSAAARHRHNRPMALRRRETRGHAAAAGGQSVVSRAALTSSCSGDREGDAFPWCRCGRVVLTRPGQVSGDPVRLFCAQVLPSSSCGSVLTC